MSYHFLSASSADSPERKEGACCSHPKCSVFGLPFPSLWLGSGNSIDYIQIAQEEETFMSHARLDNLSLNLRKHQDKMLRMLRQMVEAESPSTDKAAVDRFSKMVGAILRTMGAQVRGCPSSQTGNHLRPE